MSATGPFANILSERAALLEVVAGAVETVAEEEPEDGLVLEEEVKVAGREPVEVSVVEVSVVEVSVVSGVETVEGVLDTSELAGEVTATVEDSTVIGPGPRLNRRVNK
jgi:hypothetical protein